MGQILYKDRYLRYMDIKTNYFNMTQIEADSANDMTSIYACAILR